MDSIAELFNQVFGDAVKETDSETMQRLKKEYAKLEMKNGQLCGLQRMVFTVGIFVGIDKLSYSHRYCYHNLRDALDAYKDWNGVGEPEGFIVRKGLGADYNPSDPFTRGKPL